MPHRGSLARRPGEAKEHKDRSIDPEDIFVGQTPDARLHLRLRDRRDFVDHELTRRSEPILRGGLDRQAQQWCVNNVGCEGADRN